MSNSSILPKVSVLIPAYNEEKYILKTLEALLKQDYPLFEIIIANNASTDHTAILVEQFIQAKSIGNRIQIKLVHEVNKGTNFARERARTMATGSIIAQIDADCIPPKNWISNGVAALCKVNTNRVAVTGPYDYFDGEKWMRLSSLLSQKILYPLINQLVQALGRGDILIGGNAFIKAAILEQVGGYNTALTFYGDDIDLGKRLAQQGRIAYVGALIQLSSSRRYKANGFWQVNKKYQNCFWELISGKNSLLLMTTETSHPR